MRVLILTFFTIILFFTTISAHALDGIPSTMQVGKTKLILNGAGKRIKLLMRVYNAGLYLQNKSGDANKIIAANEPMAIRMKITSSFASGINIKASLLKSFNNVTGGNTAPIQTEIDQLLDGAFKGRMSKGDVFDLVYTPGVGTQVIKNAKKMMVVKGLPIKRALFGIWLSETAAQISLKDDLLGKVPAKTAALENTEK